MPQLAFVFTEDSFRVDHPERDVAGWETLRAGFLRDKYSALFKLGFEPESKGESPSLRRDKPDSVQSFGRPFRFAA